MGYATVEDTFNLIKTVPSGLELAEFGVYNGNTFKRLIEGAISVGNPFRYAWGFDVFKGGLPPETDNIYHNPEWVEGAFDVSRDFNLTTVDQAIKFVSDKVGHNDMTVYIPGYYSKTLTPYLASEVGAQPISYAHIDCDIHSSSLEVLNWLFKYKLLHEDAIIRFDDYNSTPNNGGQRLAWTQTVARYNVVASQYFDNVFKVTSYVSFS